MAHQLTRIVAVLTLLSPFAARPLVIEGSTGPGSVYELRVPDAGWNGDLVVYLHGITSPQSAVAIPTDVLDVAIRDGVLARGFAWAASSFSMSGWNIRDAAQRSHQLSGLFTARVAPPHRVFLLGTSMGSLAAVELAERFPEQYAGALLACGPLAGTREQFEYVGDVRNLFDLFYPGALPGTAAFVPEPICDGDAVAGLVVPPILANPTSAFLLATMAQTQLPFTRDEELVRSIALPIGWQLCNTPYLAAAAHGTPYDNLDTKYGPMAGLPEEIRPPSAFYDWVDASIARFDADPESELWTEHGYTPTGALQFPVVTLHTTLDPGVPAWLHEPGFAELVNDAGASSRLVQRTAAHYGHCQFAPSEVLGSFDALVGWVDGGPRPAGGDVTAP